MLKRPHAGSMPWPSTLRLEGLLRAVNPRSPNAGFTNKIVPYLVEVWLDDYARTSLKADIVETTVSGFSYLFDVISGRLIAAWGISEGRHGEPRDKAAGACAVIHSALENFIIEGTPYPTLSADRAISTLYLSLEKSTSGPSANWRGMR